MPHEIHRVASCQKVAQFTLRVGFNDGTSQIIDFRPVLKGDLYGPLQDPTFFDRVTLDNEARTLVWPNDADFDPAILHNWPESGPALAALAETWESNKSSRPTPNSPPWSRARPIEKMRRHEPGAGTGIVGVHQAAIQKVRATG